MDPNIADHVCVECGSTPIFERVDDTRLGSRLASYHHRPVRCSNPQCENYRGGRLGGFTVHVSEWRNRQQ
jgi:hypothetical protein